MSRPKAGAEGRAMTSVDCTTQNRLAEAPCAQGPGRFHGNPQQQADQLVRAIVLQDFGQKGGGVPGLASALGKVLSASDVPGTDAPDDVLKKIEASLKKAAQALADRGYDAKTIDATIDKFRAQLADALDKLARTGRPDGEAPASGSTPATIPTSSAPAPAAPPKDETLRVERFVAREVRRQRGAIDIQTADGDVVSIRFRTKDVVTDRYRQMSDASGTSVSARESVVSRGRLQIAVDGSLDDDELAAIGDLLDKVDALASKFFSGDVQAAFAAASDLGVDSDEIASYQLDLTYSRKLAVAASTRIALPVASQPVSLPKQPPAAQPTQQTPSAPAAQPQAPPASQSPGSSESSTPDATSPPPSEPEVTPATTRKTIADYIGDVLSKLGSVDGAGRLAFTLRFKVSVLTNALQTLQASSASAKDPAAKSTQLLTDSLGKAVA
jgi:hypothetical protein